MIGTKTNNSVLIAAAAAALAGSAQATALYWDGNGTSAGAGNTTALLNRTWGTYAAWNTDSTGGGAGTIGTSTTADDDLYFVAGPSSSSGNVSHTITLSGTQLANSLNFQRTAGTTISGGTAINLDAGISIPQYAYGATNNAAVTISTPIALQASQTFANYSSNSLTIGGTVSGGFSLTKSGSGSMTLSVANTYTGTTTILGGTVTIANTAAFGNATSTILLGDTSGSTAAGITLGTVAGNFSRNIEVQSGGDGAITLNAGSTSGRSFTGTVTLGSAGAAGRSIVVSGGNVAGFTGVMQDNASRVGAAGTVTINPSGSVTYFGNGSNSYSGGTIINSGGSLSFGTGGTGTFLGAGTVTINGMTLNQQGSNVTVTTNDQVWNGDWGTSGGGAGSLTFTLNTGKTIDLGATGTSTTRTLTIGQTSTTINGIIKNGTNGFTASLTKAGTKLLTLNGANTYTGGTVVDAGNLQFGAGAVPATGQITVNAAGSLNATGAYAGPAEWIGSSKIAAASAGSLALTGNSAADVDFSGYPNLMLGAAATATYTGTISPANSTYRLGGGGSTLTLSTNNALTGANALVIGAAGAAADVVLTGSNNFSGGTIIASGRVQVGKTNALGTGNVLVQAGGRLDMNVSGGNVSIPNAVTINGTAGSGALRYSQWGSAGLTGKVTLGSDALVSEAAGVTGDLTLSGGIDLGANTLSFKGDDWGGANFTVSTNAITGTGSLVLTHGGSNGGTRLNLNAPGTYTGTTSVQHAKASLYINNTLASNVSVSAGFVGGTGTIAPTASTVIGNGSGTADSTIDAAGSSIGTLTLGSLSLASDARVTAQINSTTLAADQLKAYGNVTIDAATQLIVTDAGSATLTGGEFVLLRTMGGASITGTFAGLPDGAQVVLGANTYTIDYTPDRVALVIPEPASLLSAGAMALALLGGRRRRVA